MNPPAYGGDVSRAHAKLAAALDAFQLDPTGLTIADLGCNAGGFTASLLDRGAARVYAVDRGYGVLDYRLRRDARVVACERTDALRVHLPEPMDAVVIDVGWTRQQRILPVAARLLAPAEAAAIAPGSAAVRASGRWIVSLIKPHYEAEPAELSGGVLAVEKHAPLLERLRREIAELGLRVVGEVESPIAGHGGNREYLWHIRQREE